jgi:hypothetical protein
MRLVVRQHRPLRVWLLAVLFLAVLAGTVLAALDYGKWRYIFQEMAASAEQKEFWEIRRALERENRGLKERTARLESANRVDEEAYAAVEQDLKTLQGELLDLREEVEFYRSILASTRSGEGLKIQGLTMHELGTGQHRYRYKLVLTHVNKDDKVAAGSVAVTLEGPKGGRSLDLRDIVEPGATDLKFNFKHFTRFEGVVSIPQDFRPERVLVAVTEEGAKAPRVQRTYDWNRLLE